MRWHQDALRANVELSLVDDGCRWWSRCRSRHRKPLVRRWRSSRLRQQQTAPWGDGRGISLWIPLSLPPSLWLSCNLYIFRHIYSTRHIGLKLGGNGDAELVASGCMREGTHRGPTESGMYADAGHAQAGPSTGGYTVELGSTTLHAVSGQHHATTLGTSDSESYEVSRAVATALAFRSRLGCG